MFYLHIPHPSYCDIVIDHDEIKSLPDSDSETYISHLLLIHLLTKEGAQMA